MEVFGWVCLIVFALIGAGTIGAFVGPSAVEKIKTLIYKAKKFAEVAKEYIDAKAEIKRAKNAAKLNKEPVENTEAKADAEVTTPTVETPNQEGAAKEQDKEELKSEETSITENIATTNTEATIVIEQPVVVNQPAQNPQENNNSSATF